MPGLGAQDRDGSCFFPQWCSYPPGCTLWQPRGTRQSIYRVVRLRPQASFAYSTVLFCDPEEIDACGQTRPQLDPALALHGPLFHEKCSVRIRRGTGAIHPCSDCQDYPRPQTTVHGQIEGAQDRGCTNRSPSQATANLGSKGMSSRAVYLPLIRTNLIDSKRDGK